MHNDCLNLVNAHIYKHFSEDIFTTSFQYLYVFTKTFSVNTDLYLEKYT